MPAFQGTNYIRVFSLCDCNDVPIDITGWEFQSQIRDSRDDEEVLLELTTLNGGWAVVDGPNGRLQMTIAWNGPVLPVGKMIFDVLRTDLSSGPYWIFEAVFLVKKPITRQLVAA